MTRGNGEASGGRADAPLVAVVAKRHAQTAVDAFREAGVYDDERRVRERDDDAVAVPVTADPRDGAAVPVRDVVRATDPAYRRRGLDDLLRERGWDADDRAAAPGSWAVVGSVILAAFPGSCPDRAAVGEALLDLHGEADTVLARRGIDGPHREPDVEVIAGEGDTGTVHTEHGTKYALDLAEVMFSPGNQAERARMGRVVEADERVLDMFAGIGYFALPMARAGADVTAVERNPTACRYLVENVALNDVRDRLTPVRADCRDAIGPDGVVDERSVERVVMGHYDAHEYLDRALAAVAAGGTVHLHATTPDARPNRLIDRLDAAADAAGRAVEIRDRRRVKSYAAGVAHVVVDARVA